MKSAPLLLAALTLFAAVPGLAQPSSKTVYRSGNWYVVRSTQPVTGAVACTGFYMGQGGVQLGRDSLLIKTADEVKSVSLRFGEQPARAARALDPNERQMGAVMVAGADFELMRRGKSLALELVTAKGNESHSLKLEGLDAALKNIDAGCPLPAASARAERAQQQARAKAQASRCTPEGVEKQRAMGVPEWRIAARCPQAQAARPAGGASSAK